MKKNTEQCIKKISESIYPKEDIVMAITTTEESQQDLRRECFEGGMIYALQSTELFSHEGYYKHKWISVKERLPENNTPVLAYHYNGVELCFYNETNGWQVCYTGNTFLPTHWQPVPASPQ